MSITRAFNNAISGLTATAKGTKTVSANLANALTPGYARREVALSSQSIGGGAGGVRIDGVNRMVDACILAEHRLAAASVADISSRESFLVEMDRLFGAAGQPGSLSSALTDLDVALTSAVSRPDEEIRLTTALSRAGELAQRLNDISNGIQNARSAADADIALQVDRLNSALDRVTSLNRRITVLASDGTDVSSLMDERQAAIDQINQIVPVQEITRPGGKVALFSSSGAVLLDGTRPVRLAFAATGEFTLEMAVGSGTVGQLIYDGVPQTAAQMRLFAGGTLGAGFAVRDQLAPELQAQIDALALDLHDRFADPAVDPTIPPGGTGLFTDNGTRAGGATVTGLAARLTLNLAVGNPSGVDAWRLRDGLHATAPGPVGNAGTLQALRNSLQTRTNPLPGGPFTQKDTAAGLVANVHSRLSSQRLSAQADHAVRSGRAETLATRLAAEGVDSDAEMQRLLQYEQAYAANARVIQAIDEMMDAILRL